MSKHDLKGMDLGKVGANKDVDFTFKEYMDTFGVKDSTAQKAFEKVFKDDAKGKKSKKRAGE